MLEDLAPYLERLEALPFVRRASACADGRNGGDAVVRLATPEGRHTLSVIHKRGRLGRAQVERLVVEAARAKAARPMVFAPYVPGPTGARLASGGIGYMDLAGNCHLDLDGRYLAHVEGRTPAEESVRSGREQGFRAPAYRVLFALLAQPELAAGSLREIAASAGVSKNAVAGTLARLEAEGKVLGRRGRRRFHPSDSLLDRWLVGYRDLVRPKLLVGRFRTPDDTIDAREASLAAVLSDEAGWAWGGATAARQLLGHYRGPWTILHLDRPLGDLRRRLRAVPAPDGPLWILQVPGPVAWWQGRDHPVVHPLLVYSELMMEDDTRALEAATAVREEYLPWIR